MQTKGIESQSQESRVSQSTEHYQYTNNPRLQNHQMHLPQQIHQQSSTNPSLTGERNSKQTSYITEETRFTNIKSHSLEDQGYSLPGPQLTQIQAAKKRYSKLHGKNFGRSLTLEQSNYRTTQESKYRLLVILLVCGMALLGSILVLRTDKEKQKTREKATGKVKKTYGRRRGSKQ